MFRFRTGQIHKKSVPYSIKLLYDWFELGQVCVMFTFARHGPGLEKNLWV